jgi:[histone H3]-lysine36 N-dimethyltransferase SETMAR
MHSKFLSEGQTVNKEYYLSVMRRLKEQIRRKRLDLRKAIFRILRYGNVPSHRAIIVNEFSIKHSTNTIEQPPYSPDMAPANFSPI